MGIAAAILKIVLMAVVSIQNATISDMQDKSEHFPVCHSIREDEPPYDCDYVHHAWIPRNR